MHKALSFGLVVTPSPASLAVVTKSMIKEMNGDKCTVGAL